jgi:hypothetical protein
MIVKQPPQIVFCIFGMTGGGATEFRREVDENCALLLYPKSKGSLQTSVRNCHYSLRNNPEDRNSNSRKFLPLEERAVA